MWSLTSPPGRSADPQAFRGRQKLGDVQRRRGRREVGRSKGNFQLFKVGLAGVVRIQTMYVARFTFPCLLR